MVSIAKIPSVLLFYRTCLRQGQNIVLKDKTVFANNTADFGGSTTTVKCTL